MNNKELLLKLNGYNSIEDAEEKLGVDREKAIYLIYRLRKGGFVDTIYGKNGKRLYYISLKTAIGGTSYIQILNKYSPNKLADFGEYRIYGISPSIEETLIYAISKGEVRYIIACLALFSKIKNWSELYQRAKKMNLVRQVVALYDVSRLVVPKVRRMPKRFRNLALPKKGDKYKYILEGFDSMHFKDIEKKWRVYIPLNWGDIQEYKGVFT